MMDRDKMVKEIFSWVKEIAIILLITWLIITFVAQNTKVSGQSMEPTLHDKDFLIINKFIYNFTKPAKGDIIVFPHNGNNKELYIKRVIGLPGDEIELKNAQVYVNGAALYEDYISETTIEKGNITFPFTVPEGEYFVMGDNRNNSRDSRFTDVGTVPLDEIVGKASVRLFPMSDFGLID